MATFADRMSQARQTSAPAGLAQQDERAAAGGNSFYDHMATQAARSPKWATGGQLGDQANGFDTPFYRTMFSQMEEESNQGRSAGDLYGRKDYTGIVLHDAMNGRSVGLESGAKFGDIFENGKRVGNIRTDFSEAEGNIILSQLMFQPKEQAELYAKPDPAKAMSEAIAKESQRVTKELSGYLTQQDYQADVEREQKELLDSGGVRVGSAAAGTVGGAAVGAGVAAGLAALLGIAAAPFTGGGSLALTGVALTGGLVGGAAGLAGAELNRDQITEEMARAKVQSEMDSSGSHFSTQLMNWSGVAQKAINPLSNLTQGAYDAATGKVGDAESEFYRLTEDGERKAPGVVQAAGMAASFVDAVGLSNPIAGGIYQLTMSGQILGKAGELTVEGGRTFDDRAGIYRNVYEDGNAAAAWGSAGIDLAQLGLFKGIQGKVSSSHKIGEWQEVGAARSLSPFTPKGAAYTTEVNGLRFFGTKGADGAMKVSDTVRRPITTYFAPSELITSITPRFNAMRSMESARRAALTGDDIYRSAMSLASGERKFATALINGFGEASEEVIQAYLDPISLGYDRPEFEDVREAAIQGFLLGTGMTLGMNAHAASGTDIRYKEHVALAEIYGEPVMTREEFNQLSAHEQSLKVQLSHTMREFLGQTAQNVGKSFQRRRDATTGELAARVAAEKYYADKDSGKLNDRLDSKMQISGILAGTARSDGFVTSIQQVAQIAKKNAEGRAFDLKELEADPAADQVEVVFAQKAAEGTKLIADLVAHGLEKYETARAEYKVAVKNKDSQAAGSALQSMRAHVDRVNKIYAAAFDGGSQELQGLLGTDKAAIEAIRRAGSVMLARYPLKADSSTLALVPQAHYELSVDGIMNGAMVSHAILPLIEGDYDGDTMSTQLTKSYSRAAFIESRSGIAMIDLAATKISLRQRDFAYNIFNEITAGFDQAFRNSAAADASHTALKRIRSALFQEFGGDFDKHKVVGSLKLEELANQFESEVKAGNAKAYENLLNKLVSLDGTQIFSRGRATGRNSFLWFDDAVMRILNNFQLSYSSISKLEIANGDLVAYTKALDTPGEDLLKGSGSYHQRVQYRAANMAATIGNFVAGDSMLRKFQRIYYTPIHSRVEGAYTYNPKGEIKWLESWYASVQNEIESSELESRDPRNTPEAKIRSLLNQMVQEANIEESYMGGPLLFALMRMPIPSKMNEHGVPTKYRKSASMLQALTWSVIQQQKRKENPTESEMTTLKELERLTQAGNEVALAMRIFEATTLEELGVSSFSGLGVNLTLGQLKRKFIPLSSDDRAEVFRVLKRQAEYTESNGMQGGTIDMNQIFDRGEGVSKKGLLPYRMVVDILEEVSNGELVWRPGDDLAGGRLGDLKGGVGWRRSKKFKDAYRLITDGMKNVVGSTSEHLTVDEVYRARQLNSEIDAKIANLLAMEIRSVALPDDGTGAGAVSWIDEMFTMSPAKAEVFFLVMEAQSRFFARGAGMDARSKDDLRYDPTQITNRLEKLLYELNFAAQSGDLDAKVLLARLLKKFKDADSVQDLMRFLNTQGYVQPGELPFISWVQDTDVFNPDKGVMEKSSFADAEREEALDSLYAAAKRFNKDTFTEKQYRSDGALAARLLRDDLSGNDLVQRQRLKALIERGFMRKPALGMTAAFQHAFATLRGIDKNSHSKGVTKTHSVALGTYQQRGEHGQWGNPLEQMFADLTSTDMLDIISNANILADDSYRITLPDGRQVTWTVDDAVDYFLTHWQNLNERPALRAIFLPSMLDSAGESGALARFSVGPTTLEKMVTRNFTEEVLGEGGKDSDYFYAIGPAMEAFAKDEAPLLMLMDAINIARVPGRYGILSSQESEKIIRETTSFVIKLSKLVGQMSPKGLEDLHKTFKEVLLRQFGKTKSLTEDARRDLERMTKEKKKLHADIYKTKIKELQKARDKSASNSKKQELTDKIKQLNDSLKEALDRIDKEAEIVDKISLAQVESLYGLTTKAKDQSKSERTSVQANLLDYVLHNWNALSARHGTNIDLLNKFNDFARDAQNNHRRKDSGNVRQTKFDDADWFALSKMVITSELHAGTYDGPLDARITSYPGLDHVEKKYFDPAFGYLADMLLDADSPFVRGTKELWKNRTVADDAKAADEARKLLVKFFDKKDFHTWDLNVAAQTQMAANDIRSSGTQAATPEAGQIPKTDISLDRYSSRTMDVPPAELLTKATIPLSWGGPLGESLQLGVDGYWSEDVPVKAGDNIQVEKAPLSRDMLRGRGVASLKISLGGQVLDFQLENKAIQDFVTEAEMNFTTRFRHEDGVDDYPVKFLSVENLEQQLPLLLKANGIDTGTPGLSVELEFYHPDSQPAVGQEYKDWGNSVAFEGVGGPGDNFNSLIGAFDLNLGGWMDVSQGRAITSSKKGLTARFNAAKRKFSSKEAMNQNWTTDLASVLNAKTDAVMSTIIGTEPLPAGSRNAIYKRMKLAHWVRGLDAEGNTILLPAEEVINLQRAGVDLATKFASNMELVEASPKKLRTMLGEPSDQGLATQLDQTRYDISKMEKADLDVAEILKRDPSLSDFSAEVDLLTELAPYFKATREARSSGLFSRLDDKQVLRRMEILKEGERRVREERQRTKFFGIDTFNEAALKRAYEITQDDKDFTANLDFDRFGLGESINREALLSTLTSFYQSFQAESNPWNLFAMFEWGPRNKAEASEQGTLTQYDIFGKRKGRRQLTLGDWVAINVASFAKGEATFEQQQENLKNVVTELANQGVNIILLDENGERDLRSSAWQTLTSMNYSPSGDNVYVWQLDMEANLRQNKLSELTGLLAQHEVDPRRINLGIISDALPVDEGQAIVLNKEALKAPVQISTPILPTSGLWNFNIPRGNQIQKVKAAVLLQLENDEIVDKLIEASKPKTNEDQRKLTNQLLEYRDWLDENLQSEELMPLDWKFGSIIPLYNAAQNRVFLHRWNMEPHYDSILEQYEETPGIAIASSTPDSTHTAYEGTFVTFHTDNSSDLRVELQTTLSQWIDKMAFSGLKVTTTPDGVPALMPTQAMFKNLDAVLGINVAALRDKEIDSMVTNMKRGFSLFGHNPEASIARVLLAGQKFDDSTREGRAARREAVSQIMEHFSRKVSKNSLETAKQMFWDFQNGTNPTGLLEDLSRSLPDMPGFDADALHKQLNVKHKGMSLDVFTTLVSFMYLSTVGTRWGDIEGFEGVAQYDGRTDSSRSREMNSLYTNAFDSLELGSTARRELFARFNENFETDEYALAQDWTLIFKNGKNKSIGYLAMLDGSSTGDNPERFRQSESRNKNNTLSFHNNVLTAMANDATDTIQSEGWRLDRFRESSKTLMQPMLDDDSTMFDIFNVMNAEMPELQKKFPKKRRFSAAEIDALQFNAMAVAATRTEVTVEKEHKKAFEALIDEVRQAYHLPPSMRKLVHFWLRQNKGSLVTSTMENTEMSWYQAEQILEELKVKANTGRYPTFGANIPIMYLNDLRALFVANQGVDGGFVPDNGKGDPIARDDWDGWVQAAIGEYAFDETQVIDPLFITAMDGMLNSYMDLGGTFSNLPVTKEALKGNLDENGDLIISFSAPKRKLMNERAIFDAQHSSLDKLITQPHRGERMASSWRILSQKSREGWRKENKVAPVEYLTMRDIRKHGRVNAQELGSDNAFLQGIIQLRVIMALGNPGLPVSAIMEAGVWGVLSDMSNLLTGTGTGAIARAGQAIFEKTPEAVQRGIEQVFGASTYTSEDLRQARQNERIIGQSVAFRKMIYGDTNFQTPQGRGLVTRALGRAANFVSVIQDPTFGMRGDLMVRRYQEAVIGYATRGQTSDTTVSPGYLLAQFSQDPLWFKNNSDPVMRNAHRAGLNAIEDTRGLKATPASLAIKGAVDYFANSPSMLVAVPSTLILKVPTLFATYGMNVFSKVFGLQGLNAALAMTLHGRKKFWAQGDSYSEKSPDKAYLDMSKVIESADLTKEFMQSGLSLTSLFAFGMIAGSLGLTGEDEETKRRKRMAHFQGWQFLYDPTEIENDWRNADAVFFDNIPFLRELFAVSSGDSDQGYKSMAQMSWILKQFVSPLMGFERYANTGDIRQVMWGFMDAVNSFPIINMDMWNDANVTAARLQAEAQEQEVLGGHENIAEAFNLTTKLVMAYERMLFENSFVNMLYVGSDEYDRDPFVLVERDESGNIIGDRMTNPEQTNALSTFQDEETGEIRQGYAKNDTRTAKEMSYAEKSLGYAVFKSLTTGNFDLSKSPWMRKNMAVKERKIDLEGVDYVTAKDLVLSVYNNETGNEELTYNGARAILNGVMAQSVSLDSPALQGIYITPEQRQQLHEDILVDLTNQGTEVLELTEREAVSRAWDIMKGQGDYANSTGLSSIIWSKQIPSSAEAVYQQLNTTYIQGPDGSMWATGITREKLLNFIGLEPFTPYFTGNSQLGVDSRLNSTDPVFNLNTGMRGLVRKEESEHIKTLEELMIESDERLGKLIQEGLLDLKDGYTNYEDGYGNYKYRSRGWRSGGGRGGSGGSSYAPKINIGSGIREPYFQAARTADAGNPSIRRASIRRERFSSNRGRLKQWQ